MPTATEWTLYSAADWETGKRKYYPQLDPTADRNIDQWTLTKLRSDARKVFVNFGPLRTAVYERARYSVGHAWIPRFQGADTDWGKAASDWELLFDGAPTRVKLILRDAGKH